MHHRLSLTTFDIPQAMSAPPPAYADPPSPEAYSEEASESATHEADDSAVDDTSQSQRSQPSQDDASQEDDDELEEEEGEETPHEGEEDPNDNPERKSSLPKDYHHLRLRATPTLPLTDDASISFTVREIGKSAQWSLSTAKPGNGVDQLRDSSLDTYWQSDGLQPHYINIQFPRRQTVSAIALYMDFNLDESYTPKKMKVRVGTTFHNLEEVRVVDVKEPIGWVTIPLWRKWGEDVLDPILDPEGEMDEDDEQQQQEGRRKKRHVPVWKRKPMRTHFVQLGITSMHQNGRDTHIRQVKIFGPRDDGSSGSGSSSGMSGKFGFGSSYRGLKMNHSEGKGGGEMMMSGGKLSMPAFQTVGMSQFSTIR